MANEPIALAKWRPPVDAPGVGDYEALSALLSSSARGRAFLAEHAQRSRNGDIERLLAAIGRLEALLQARTAPSDAPHDGLAAELQANAVPARAAKLTALLDLLEYRLTAMATPPSLAAATDRPQPEKAQRMLPAELPEQPIPSPAPLSAVAPASRADAAATKPPICDTAGSPDPLAALMTLSEEERIALFT